MSEFTIFYHKALADNRILQYEEHADTFERLAVLLRQTNEKYNLTAITDDAGIAYRHFADCLLAAHLFPHGAKVLDVGCGGGFPTLPLAIVRPDLTVTAMDSTAKKLGFIREAAEALGLNNVTTLCARAEEAAHTPVRESFDAVCARAVARLNILAEWCVPFVKTDGIFLALKGKDGLAELAEASHAFEVLHCTAEGEEYQLLAPESEGREPIPQSRCVITARKTAPTPAEYPRNGGKIKKKPL